MKRRIFSVLIALALCLSLLPVPALAEEGDPAPQADQTWDCGDSGNNVTATLSDDGTLTISGSGAMTDFKSALVVPWYSSRQSIKEVIIQDNVTSIGSYALGWCKMKTISIADSVQSIGICAFYNCTALTSVKIPEGVKTIEASTFARCSALSSVTIPSTVTTIGDNAFDGCKALESVEIPNGVTSIGSNAFCDCSALTRVDIPASVQIILSRAFNGAPNAEIHYEGTLAKWNSISGGNSGASQDKIATDRDATGNVTVDGSLFKSGVREGETVTVSAGTMEGKAFAGWTVTGVSLTEEQAANPSLTFTMPANDVTLTANWAEAVAEANGNLFTDLQEAFDAVATEGSGTVKLLKSVTVDQPITLSEGEVILTGRGEYTLTGTGSATISVTGGSLTLEDVTVASPSGYGIYVPDRSNPTITIRDSAAVSGGPSGIVQLGGTLTFWGKAEGTFNTGTGISTDNTTLTVEEGAVISGGAGSSAGIQQAGGTLTIKGGTISGHLGLSVSASFGLNSKDAEVHLTGGKFIGSGTNNSAIAASGVNDALRALSTLLDPGYTIYKEDGTALTAEELAERRTGSGTFTVGCAHASVGTVSSSDPDENGVVTVTAACQQCKETVTLGTLTMVGSGQTITYGDPDPTFEVQAEGLTVTKYNWSGDGLIGLDTTTSTITPAVLKTGELNCTCAVTFTVPGGTGSANLKFTLTVNQLDISTVEWTEMKIGPEKATYNGQPQKLSSITVSNGRVFFGAGQFDIQFVDASGSEAAEQTDAGTYKIKLTGKDVLKGTITLDDPLFVIEPATPSIAWPEGTTEEKLTYTGEAAELKTTPTVTVTLADGAEYDGDPVTYSYAAAEAGPYTPGLPTDAGTYYVKAAVPQQKNYTAAETADTLQLTIAKAAPTLTPPTAKTLTYNGTAQALVTAAEASVGEVQYALSEDGPWSTTIPTATAPGEYTVWYKVDETANYTGVEAASVPAKIEKATVAAASQSLPVKNNLEKTYTLDLSPYLPTLPQGQEYGKLTYELTETEIYKSDYIAADTVKLEGTVLTVPVNEVDETEEGLVAAIRVTIQSDNFQDIRLTVSVTATNKTPLIITGVTAQGWTYDGTVHPGYTGTPRAEGYTGEFLVTYFTKDRDRKDAGTFEVLFTPVDSNYAGELRLPYTVEPAQVTVKADNQTATVGDAMPKLTWRVVSGLASGETLKTNPTPACDADMSKAGTYPITISGGEVPGGGNYKAEIVYQNGTLTVKEKSAPPKPVDPKPPVDPDGLEVKLEVKEGFTEVPPALRALEHLNTPEKLTQVMRTAVTRTGVPSGNTAVYDVSLMVSTDGGRTWVPATSANFPSGGLTVTLPYPAGTDSTYQFTVVHMFTSAAFGKTPGDTESPAVTNTAQGLRFTVTGLSPISLGWKARTTGTGGSSGGGSSSSGGSSSGGGSRPMASVTVERAEHGKVTSDRSSAGSGSLVTLTVQPDRGYRLESLTVTDSRGNKLQLTARSGGKYAFTMPGGNVTVKAVFTPLADSGACDGGAACPSRAQFAQILYNKEGRPAGVGSAPFTDVAPDAWCAPAVAWAAERGISGGYGGGLFGPDDAITREQLAVMLWRYAGSPAAPSGELSFMDAGQIGAHAREALGWAVHTGVMNGKAGGVLDPKGQATRAQTAQMLKNFLENG